MWNCLVSVCIRNRTVSRSSVPMPPSRPSRPYRGADAQQRAAERRERLIAAGIQIFGTSGYRTASVDRLCTQAGLTKRYFYESFSDSEALLLACYERVNTELLEAMIAAVGSAGPSLPEQSRAAVAGFFTAIDEDVRIARITLLEILGVSPAIDQAYRAATDTFARTVILLAGPALASSELPEEQQLAVAQGIIGAITTIAVQWILDARRQPRRDVIAAAHAVVLGTLLHAAELTRPSS